ncbi:MAG: p21-activated protein kinase-interacting protein 1-like protein [Caeruleum heppii]|nr:MAG: p21-activated protein kinase-interacting protein 1-like protein [Caeruleum heppii]
MGKRKRAPVDGDQRSLPANATKVQRQNNNTIKASHKSDTSAAGDAVVIQIITGSYERVLHGITATIQTNNEAKDLVDNGVTFADTFLFNAHSSAIRCLAVSPPSESKTPGQDGKVILASGSTDERINLYHLSTAPPPTKRGAAPLPSLAPNPVTENPRNRELGSLLHHSSSVSALYFSTRSKLLSSAEDNTIAITRTRDWTALSTIKAPIPKAIGRPSGDTAPPGGTPAGVNDFAVHPSMKLMLSVGKGERCMRLWNLVSGKKAGVLNFSRELLRSVGEGKRGIGEARRVVWNARGDEFVILFEKGAVVYGIDSKPKARILPSPPTKIHQIHHLSLPSQTEAEITPSANTRTEEAWVLSTEDGRLIFYRTTTAASISEADETENELPDYDQIASLGGKAQSCPGRIRDFEILTSWPSIFFVTGSSDGRVRLWSVAAAALCARLAAVTSNKPAASNGTGNPVPNGASLPDGEKPSEVHIGSLLGTYETGNRITCLKAFIMTGQPTDTPPTVEAPEASEEDEEATDSG